MAAIGLLILGTGLFRLALGTASFSVPAGVKAGSLTLKPCIYPTENGSGPAECGTLVVPENRADSKSRLIALPVVRIRARSGRPREPVFRLGGGPGQTNMKFREASRVIEDHDVILAGYRGVDGSVRLDCPEVESELRHSNDLIDGSFRGYADALRACASRFRHDGVDLNGYGLEQQADDLEAARVAFGYDRIALLSQSAGTRTALIYAWRYPRNVYRSVMIGVNPPGYFLWDEKTTDEQIRRYAMLCAEDSRCRARTGDLVASMKHTADHIPDRWWFFPIKKGNVRLATFFGLMNATSAAGALSAPSTLDSWLSAAEGDASGFWFLSLVAELVFPRSFVWGQDAAAASLDARAATAYYSAGGDHGSILRNPGSAFLWAGGGLVDAWPTNASVSEYDHVHASSVETLLIGGTLDFSTPVENATRQLLPYLSNGRQVVLPGLGHTTDFWSFQPEASRRLIGSFLAQGTVDDSLYKRADVDFSPAVTQTYLAKAIVSTAISLALLAVASLLWMAGRVRRNGRFGRKSSTILRSLYPMVLGLGGWCLWALLILTTAINIPLDDEWLVVLSIGLPVGLGIYFAWVNGDRSSEARTVSAAAAVASALVGSWLAIDPAQGLLAPITAIVGASVGANLTLIVFDIVSDRHLTRNG